MAKMKKNPSRAGISAASVKGNAGPGVEETKNKVNSQNNQFKK
ncbi:YuzL-like protein [Cytobacillus horneckiae]|uniref:YuzL family protein n=1 Tax=Cytobacillus horneckiae TaxID=549687 RepID=A0A2N0ZN89_9BACI|nr:YuzL family protein [Cytobacillus horneckiae]NRG48123.1 YuzL family protein [Bacillus sp. CRN 9]MBN6889125.1 YuzL family protein [Cytobacillus horneckiae]MCM3180689.1 YuzL family protein [Cytobacillus horneckiae]MEC1158329.1 YuzL family protein [Cytobacillus horneckiae]MED2936483.1 YuzL family protein [Cytobacillus horneckiae]